MRSVIITATSSMSNETYDLICAKIENKYSEKFIFTRVDDPSIVGGFILNIESKIYDLSIKTQLEELGEYILK